MPSMLTPKEAAQEYRLGESRVRRLVREGEIPALKIQSRILIPKPAMDAYIERALAGLSNDPQVIPTHDPATIAIR